MIPLEESDHGVILRVHAQPGARKNEIRGVMNGALRVAITAAPEKGKANRAIVNLLSETLEVPKSDVELLGGSTSRAKRFLLRGVRLASVEASIGPLLRS